MSQTIAVWKCPAGHVMGQVRRNGRGIRQLLLYRQAIDLDWNEEDGMEEVDILAVVEGQVMNVRCSICERVRTWAPGKESERRRGGRREGAKPW